MKQSLFLYLTLSLLLCACQELIDAPVPNLAWAAFDAPSAKPLTAAQATQLEGIYTISEDGNNFGKEAALKCSYQANGADTTYFLSFFCAEDVRYFICQGKKTDTAFLLNGYWRNVENTKTGKVYLTVQLAPKIIITGHYGRKDGEPDERLTFTYARPLYNKEPYALIAHRGGGRNNDLLPASENSLEMIELAARLGANGIEIDVQLTKDGVPVLFHDANVNDRLTTKTGIHGPISDYTMAELNNEVNLKRGGKVPTLQQALETIVTKTPLETVWLDCKYKEVIPAVARLQKEFTSKAVAAGRRLSIIIGLPDEEVLSQFMQLSNYQNIPSLCELDTAKAAQVNAAVWAPSWVKGHQDEEVNAVHRRGKKAFVWTVDIPDKIKEFIYEAKFDGMVTNRPTMAAYYYYAQQ